MSSMTITHTDLPGDLWRAVLERDERSSKAFVYAVRSTGIYCRPGCPSRRPRRDNVLFFPGPGAAEAAGFRACLRCRPSEVDLDDPGVRLVRRACTALDEAADAPPTSEDLSALLGVSPGHLRRTFKEVLGITPRQYAQVRRAERFKAEIRSGETVTSALYGAGYGSSSRLYESSDDELGMTPAAYGAGGRGAVIRYATVESPLGWLLVGGTERGVCAVMLGDDPRSLGRTLRQDYPAASIEEDEGPIRSWAEAVLGYLNGWTPHLDLPVDVRATAFQRRVWQELRKIPAGETRTYGEVAAAIDSPGAARAVGTACARNRVALVVPCHRVVPGGGGVGGYRWGPDRKRALLHMERDPRGRTRQNAGGTEPGRRRDASRGAARRAPGAAAKKPR